MVLNHSSQAVRWRMLDSFANSRAQLEKLPGAGHEERDPERSDELAAEIRRVLNEREFLRNRLGIKRQCEER